MSHLYFEVEVKKFKNAWYATFSYSSMQEHLDESNPTLQVLFCNSTRDLVVARLADYLRTGCDVDTLTDKVGLRAVNDPKSTGKVICNRLVINGEIPYHPGVKDRPECGYRLRFEHKQGSTLPLRKIEWIDPEEKEEKEEQVNLCINVYQDPELGIWRGEIVSSVPVVGSQVLDSVLEFSTSNVRQDIVRFNLLGTLESPPLYTGIRLSYLPKRLREISVSGLLSRLNLEDAAGNIEHGFTANYTFKPKSDHVEIHSFFPGIKWVKTEPQPEDKVEDSSEPKSWQEIKDKVYADFCKKEDEEILSKLRELATANLDSITVDTSKVEAIPGDLLEAKVNYCPAVEAGDKIMYKQLVSLIEPDLLDLARDLC